MIAPGPAASARADPEMPEKKVSVRMLVWPIPPRKRPTNCDAKRNSTSESAPPVISSAARMKNGTASSAKTSIPENIVFGSAKSGRVPLISMAASVPPPSAKATGTPSASSTVQARNSVATIASDLRRVGVELAVGEQRAPPDVRPRHQREVQHGEREADRH